MKKFLSKVSDFFSTPPSWAMLRLSFVLGCFLGVFLLSLAVKHNRAKYNETRSNCESIAIQGCEQALYDINSSLEQCEYLVDRYKEIIDKR